MTLAILDRARGRMRRILCHPVTVVALPLALVMISRAGGELALLAAALLCAVAAAVSFGGRWRADPDTDEALPGAPAFHAHLGQSLAPGSATRPACLVISPDNPPGLADALSQEDHDQYFRLAVRQLLAALRRDDVIARIDRDTLAIALSPGARTTVESVIQTALRLQRRLARPVDLGARLVETGTRIGIALPHEGEGAESLVARARAALAAASPGLIGCANVNPASDPALAIDLARDLPAAIEERQIVPYFQPQTCTETGALTGLEALARWNHPRHGLLQPAQFLGTVEAAGMMESLTDAMLSASLAALRDWTAAGLAVPRVSVNFPTQDLADPELCERVAWKLDTYDVPAALLGVEVLESVLHLDGETVIRRNLGRLHQLGCFVDLDDFGTGNASITNIRRFAVDRIKIDRSFVLGLDRDRDQRAMVAAILTMAGQLRIDTLAEGVESIEEEAILSQLGCRHIQGFSIGRPMPQAKLAEWIGARAAAIRPVSGPEALMRFAPDAAAAHRGAETPPPAPSMQARGAPLARRRGGRGKTA